MRDPVVVFFALLGGALAARVTATRRGDRGVLRQVEQVLERCNELRSPVGGSARL